MTKNVEKRGKETLFSCLFLSLFERRESFYKHRHLFYLKNGILKNVWILFLIPVKEDCYGIKHFGQCLSPPAFAEKPNPLLVLEGK